MKVNSAEETEKQTNSKKKLARAAIIVLLTIITLAIWNILKIDNIEANGLEIEAIVVDTNHQRFVLNKMDGTSVNTYFFKYEFEFEDRTYSGVHEIPSELTNKYFSEIPTKGSTVVVQFPPDTPTENQIKKADNRH